MQNAIQNQKTKIENKIRLEVIN